MRDYREISRLMERIVHKYIQLEKQPRGYGGITLTQAEVHTAAIVGDFPGINVTRLAAMRGITKGAASQMLYKLADKGIIKKESSPDSDAEIRLRLTALGQRVHAAHMQYHDEAGADLFRALPDIPEGYESYMTELLKKFDEVLDQRLG